MIGIWKFWDSGERQQGRGLIYDKEQTPKTSDRLENQGKEWSQWSQPHKSEVQLKES